MRKPLTAINYRFQRTSTVNCVSSSRKTYGKDLFTAAPSTAGPWETSLGSTLLRSI